MPHTDNQLPPWQRLPTSDRTAVDLSQAVQRGPWDVCVVGAGMAGLLTALELIERGHSVVILERDRPLAGESGKTTAHLSAVLDTRYFELQRMHGEAAVPRIIDSHRRAIAHLERLANAHEIDCDFERVSAFLAAATVEQLEELEREHGVTGAAGLGCHLLRDAPLPSGAGTALHFPDQAKFDPAKFALGVKRRLQALGTLIVAPVLVQKVEPGDVCKVTTSGGEVIEARQVVIATHSPVNDMFAMHTKQTAYRSYAVAFEIPGVQWHDLYWDMEDPYHYVRTTADGLLIVGGEDHEVGQEDDPEQRWARLETWARERMPVVGEVAHRWSGQVLEPVDGLAYIGRNPGDSKVYVATGFSGNGMTYSAITALLLADLIAGLENPWAEIYEPSRKPKSVSAVANYVSGQANVAAQYLDWLRPGDASSVEALPAGEGMVLRRGLKKLAVYRDTQGELHELSATCPHLGGIVAWNRAEKTWDCPCHGSRFDCFGKVLNGPAVSDLSPGHEQDAAPKLRRAR
jgi:glycine/D-amino acid oxidase-like deaminating enzyme/nitrite reductase/ring-hydroxylating ferredoxin subunit